MKYGKKIVGLLNNYVISRWLNKPSTAAFWYLPEPSRLNSADDLVQYQKTTNAPTYFINYSAKLSYSLTNAEGIIVLPYGERIGQQVNPEAAFQYALGLHDRYCLSGDPDDWQQFWKYVDYFVSRQTSDGLWAYEFDWYESKAPWASALAQARGASVMLRAWLWSNNVIYLTAAKKAFAKFNTPTHASGFLHSFEPAGCYYFEEYPHTPTGVINGFMASLISLWELKFWLAEQWLERLWSMGIQSLETMLPFYSNGWWSLYDLDAQSPIVNVNSPRYHLLEIHYLKILAILSDSSLLLKECETRQSQYQRRLSRQSALALKLLRKIIYK